MANNVIDKSPLKLITAALIFIALGVLLIVAQRGGLVSPDVTLVTFIVLALGLAVVAYFVWPFDWETEEYEAIVKYKRYCAEQGIDPDPDRIAMLMAQAAAVSGSSIVEIDRISSEESGYAKMQLDKARREAEERREFLSTENLKVLPEDATWEDVERLINESRSENSAASTPSDDEAAAGRA
jgi:hypothetical protein